MNVVKTAEVSHSTTAKVCSELDQQGGTANSIADPSCNTKSNLNVQLESRNKLTCDAADMSQVSGISSVASNANMGNRNDVHKPQHQLQHGTNIEDFPKKDKQQRIQFTIGKKRRKSPSADQQNKRSVHATHHVNVLETGDSMNSSPDSCPVETQINNVNNGGLHVETAEEDRMHDNHDILYDGAERNVQVNSAPGNIGTMASESIAASVGLEQPIAQQVHQQHNEDETATTTHHHRTQNHHRHHHTNHSSSQTASVNASAIPHLTTPTDAVAMQPDGWRVKLYRLNADGSWDDCGTGRIVCLISDNDGGKDKDGNLSLNIQSDRIGKNNPTVGKEWAHLEEEIYQTLGMPTLCMHAENSSNSQLQQLASLPNTAPKVLLRTRVLLRESYQQQGDNIITWCEPFFLPAQNREGQVQSSEEQIQSGNGEDVACGVDLALSFQDNAGCRDIWNKISKIQHKAYELFEARGGLSIDGGEMELQDLAQHQSNDNRTSSDNGDKDTIAHNNSDGVTSMYSENGIGDNNSADHGSVQHMHSSTNKTNHDMWSASADGNSNSGIGGIDVDEHDFMEADTAAAVSMAAQAAAQYAGHGKNQMIHHSDSTDINHTSASHAQLCNPPTLDNLEKIADVIAASQPQQRETIAMFVSQSECAYLKALLAMFPSAEAKNNYHALATLASIIKSIFLFNEPSIIQLVVSDEQIFEQCCCCLEYDPDLKEKANHRWFIRDRLKFRTVLIMEDEELIDSIHRAFRVTYIRDTLLRPTMDESSLSTLGSLLTFTHGDVVKGVMSAPRNKIASSQDSYLVRILRLLGKEIRAIRGIEWKTMGQKGRPPSASGKNHAKPPAAPAPTPTPAQISSSRNEQPSTPWKQHLAPQDQTLSSRKLRRRGCLSFLREMFNMVRTSLQQSDKDDFYAVIVLMDVKLQKSPKQEVKENKFVELPVAGLETDDDTVNLLSLLGAILSDTNADVSERGACLDILSAIASHEPSLIRKHCLDEFSSSRVACPEPNDKRQVVFACPPTDLFLSLLCVMATENDAGIMLQTCEVIRIILDTEMVNDPTQLDLGGVIDNEEDELIGSDNVSFLVGANPSNGHGGGGCEQNSFLQMFYDHYVPWLVAPFQYSILVPKIAIPFSFDQERLNEKDNLLQFLMRKHQRLKDTKISRTGLLKMVSTSAIRLSFSVELLSFCVRAHCYRMKRYLINSRVLINVIKMLSPRSKAIVPSGDRCLKLGALRCLRSIISLKDEFYNRHIVQHSLFTPVFEAFRANPVGDNLVSSSIIEICEFIRTENIKSLIEYVVTKHMRQNVTQVSPSSTDTPIVKLPPCLEDLATPYVDTLTLLRQKYEENVSELTDGTSEGDKGRRVGMSVKAIEDQRKFREADEEESYFFDDVEESKF